MNSRSSPLYPAWLMLPLAAILLIGCGGSGSTTSTEAGSAEPRGGQTASGEEAEEVTEAEDEHEAEQIYLAYGRAVGQADYTTACGYLAPRYVSKLSAACPVVMRKAFHDLRIPDSEMPELELRIAVDSHKALDDGELTQRGSRWLIWPKDSESGLPLLSE